MFVKLFNVYIALNSQIRTSGKIQKYKIIHIEINHLIIISSLIRGNYCFTHSSRLICCLWYCRSFHPSYSSSKWVRSWWSVSWLVLILSLTSLSGSLNQWFHLRILYSFVCIEVHYYYYYYYYYSLFFSASAMITFETRLDSFEAGPDSWHQKMFDANLEMFKIAAQLRFSLHSTECFPVLLGSLWMTQSIVHSFVVLFPVQKWKKLTECEGFFIS